MSYYDPNQQSFQQQRQAARQQRQTARAAADPAAAPAQPQALTAQQTANRAARQQRQAARQPPPPGPAQTGTYGTQNTTGEGAATQYPPAQQPPSNNRPPPGPGGAPTQGQGAYGYQGATEYASQQQDQGTQYERDVLGGKYLTPDSNPYLSKYADEISRKYQGNLSRGLSQVSSPFMSGATLGQTGIHGDVRGRYFNEGMQDLGGQLTGLYSGEYDKERALQAQASGDISQRTQNLRSIAAQNYGTDVQARTQIQTARIAANSALQQARMAQRLGYDQLAADYMYKYEQLNQHATEMENDYNLRRTQLELDAYRQFSGTSGTGSGTQVGPGGSTSDIAQGILGGGVSGAGIQRTLYPK